MSIRHAVDACQAAVRPAQTGFAAPPPLRYGEASRSYAYAVTVVVPTVAVYVVRPFVPRSTAKTGLPTASYW